MQYIGTLLTHNQALPEGITLPEDAKKRTWHGLKVLSLKELPEGSEITGTLTKTRITAEEIKQGKEDIRYITLADGSGVVIDPSRAASVKYFVPYEDETGEIRYLIVPAKHKVPLLAALLSVSLVLSMSATAVAGTLWRQVEANQLPPREGISIGETVTDSVDALRRQLQDQVVHMTVSINTNPVLQDDGTYNVLLTNVKDNQYNIAVSVVSQDGRQIYQSPILKPNERMDNIRLIAQLPDGQTKATAWYAAYKTEGDKLDGECVGRTFVDITFHS